MRDRTRRARARLGAVILAVLCLYAVAPALAPAAFAQTVRPPANAVAPAEMGQSPRDVAIGRYKEIWREVRRGVVGDVAIPDKRAAVLVQASGQVWRGIHTGALLRWGGSGLALVVLALGAFYALRGTIPIERGKSGRTIERFNALERFAHWLTASTFVLLAITGLNIMFGRRLFLKRPGEVSIGPDFSAGQDFYAWLTYWGKVLHDFAAWGFIAGLVLIFVLWVGQNIPNRHDLAWLAKGGGMFSKGAHVPARKFNAGQKLVFWAVVILGATLSFSGLCLLFPFQILPWNGTFAALDAIGFALPTNLLPIQEMQLSQLWHGVIALVLIAVILAHIYIGTLGMEGAFDAMGTGKVDENWAREHHDLWVEELAHGANEGGPKGGRAQPAE